MKLIPTGEMTLGPFFPREFAQGANDLTVLEGHKARGELIEVSGRITQLDGRPLDNVVVEIWQADSRGRYDAPDLAAVEGRLPHINFLLLYSGLMRQLQTVMFFELGADPVLDAVPVARRELLVAKRLTGGYRFDIRLRGETETPFFDD
ncbi:MAG: hypothetical protein E6H63_20070 [Betaproteobacteria bacterium]|nr:MAG: hypothetical protein E6H63_20070 [Betaproteobacteria bacterium]